MELSRDEIKEMMSIFKVETEEHLKNLNKGLLKLEENPNSRELLEELFRTAHSIKGSARMMGFAKIESVAHKIEDIFGILRRASVVLTPEDFDVVYEGVDLISQIMEKIAMEGTDASIDTKTILKHLDQLVAEKTKADRSSEQPAQVAAEREDKLERLQEASLEDAREFLIDEEEGQTGPRSLPTLPELAGGKLEPAERSVLGEDAFIRVPTRRLDDLMNLVSELLTTRIKSQQRLADLRKILEFCSEWNDGMNRHRVLAQRILARLQGQEQSDLTGPGNGQRSYANALASSWELRQMLGFQQNTVEKLSKLVESINDVHDKHSEDNLRTAVITTDIQDNLRIVRLLPMSTIFDLYPRMIRDIAKAQNKKIRVTMSGGETRVDKKVLEELKDPLIHLLRNSIDHGIELPSEREKAGKNPEGLITLKAAHVGNMVHVEVGDDGRGIDTERIAQIAVKKGYITEEQLPEISQADLVGLIFHSGFSTAKIITDLSGRGVGLDIVKANVERIKGTIETFSEKGRHTRFVIKIPLTLATTHALIVEVGGETYAVPIDYIERTVRITEEEVLTGGSHPYILVDGRTIQLYKLEDVLGNARQRLKNKGMIKAGSAPKLGQQLTNIDSNKLSAVVLMSGGRRVSFLVDKLLDEQEVVVKNLGLQLKRVRNVAGSTILGDGRISIILDPGDLIKSVHGSGARFVFRERRSRDVQKKKILVVDDSITTRTLEKNILESAGYHVTIATNGVEAFQKMAEVPFDLIVSDVEMPLMDGFEFAEKVRKQSKFADIPFILCTSLESEKDKRRGIEVGANAYIVKGSFDQSNLLETIEKLL
jgi:two-component system chemotaxis sensor kinase CheA